MMMQGIPGMAGNSGDGGSSARAQPQPPPQAHGGGGVGGGGELCGGFSEEERGRMEEGDRSSGGGNRWPRQETLALIKIRSEMDVAFRDSSLKGPLWEEISRKLGELGFHRSAKKCKEKFENVYKYHKRTKEGRTSKSEGKAYRFFDQLQALEASPTSGHPPPPLPLPPPPPATTPISMAMPNQATNNPVTPFTITGSHPNNVTPISVAAPAAAPHKSGFPFSQQNMSGSTDLTSSSSSSSDDEPPEATRKGKRKWKDFFGRMVKEVVEKQEELQKKFLDAIERREREQVAREEARRAQEMEKMKREHDLLAHERSMAAAKDAAVISLLQKISEQNPNIIPPPHQPPPPPPQPAIQQKPQQQQQQQQNSQTPPPRPAIQRQQPQHQQNSQLAPPQPAMQQPQPQQTTTPPPPPPRHVQPVQVTIPPPTLSVSLPTPLPTLPVRVSVSMPPTALVVKNDGGGGEANMLSPSPSRWPKAEINALIHLRTTLDTKYQENGPKGPLWEEISAAMRKLGYNRNAKRCKEKWENINKYYKKVKESNKRRPEDSKTCPYFYQLDAIYRERSGNNNNSPPPFVVKHEAPIMAQPEQQWPHPALIQQLQQQQPQGSTTNESTAMEDDHEDEEGGEYEIVSNKTAV